MVYGTRWWSARLRPRCCKAIAVEEGLISTDQQAPRIHPVCLKLTFFFGPCPELLIRLRLLITSVLRLIGRGLPWSFRKSPQALQSTEPISSRRQRGVVEVVQFWHTGCNRPCSLSVNVAMALYLDAIRVSGVGENLAIRCATREVPLFLVR